MKILINFVLFLSFVMILAACGDDKPKNKPKANPPNMTKSTDNDAAKADEEVVKSDPIPPEQLAKAKEIIASVGEDALAAVDGKKKYKTFCTACHGMDGKLAISGAKDLSKSTTTLEERVAQVYHGKGLMTPFKGVLKDPEIVAVAEYLGKLRN